MPDLLTTNRCDTTPERWQQIKAIFHSALERDSHPLPAEVKAAINDYRKLDHTRRQVQHTDQADSPLFQPLVNYRTLEFNKGLSTTQAWKIVQRWADFTGIGKLSPHDLRRTAITRALDQGLTPRQVRMMSGHKSREMVLRYDHQRENLDLNAVNFLDYTDQTNSVA